MGSTGQRALLAAIFFALVFVRRHEQLFHPQVWDEDGSVILPGLVYEGLRSVLEPIKGYFILVPRLIAMVSLRISFLHYALIGTIIAWLAIAGVALAIAISPTILRGGAILGALALLVPSDPEVIGVPLYTFWWVSLLLFVAALWRPAAAGLPWRIVFVVLGGLSSPAIFLALPIFLVRVARARREIYVATVAAICAIVQLIALLEASAQMATGGPASWLHAFAIVPKFFGTYALGNLVSDNGWILALAGLATVAVVAWAAWLDCSTAMSLLIYLWLGSVALSAARVDIALLHPVLAGPRYFFFPYVLESWLLLQIAFNSPAPQLRYLAAAALALAIANAVPVLSRGHEDLRWSENVAACTRTADSRSYSLPVQYDGSRERAWRVNFTGSLCRNLVERSLLRDWPAPPVLRSLGPNRNTGRFSRAASLP